MYRTLAKPALEGERRQPIHSTGWRSIESLERTRYLLVAKVSRFVDFGLALIEGGAC